MSSPRVDMSVIRAAFAARRAVPLEPIRRTRALPDRSTFRPSQAPAASTVTYAPAPPVKRRPSALVKAERAQRAYDRVIAAEPWHRPVRWSAPTVSEMVSLEVLEVLAGKRNTALKRAYQERVRYRKAKAAAIKAGKGPRGWRSRELRARKELGAKKT
jgi:hypothetical protein